MVERRVFASGTLVHFKYAVVVVQARVRVTAVGEDTCGVRYGDGVEVGAGA